MVVFVGVDVIVEVAEAVNVDVGVHCGELVSVGVAVFVEVYDTVLVGEIVGVPHVTFKDVIFENIGFVDVESSPAWLVIVPQPFTIPHHVYEPLSFAILPKFQLITPLLKEPGPSGPVEPV